MTVTETAGSRALALPLGLVFGASEGSAFLTEPTATLVGGGGSIIGAVTNIFSGLFTAVLYRHVLTAKEGGRQEEIAAVFD